MIYGFLDVILHTLGGVVAAAILVLGFVYLIFLGDVEAQGRSLVSRRIDRLITVVIYASWFSPLWWFGFSTPLLIVACGATVLLCLVYAASYHKAMGLRRGPSASPPRYRELIASPKPGSSVPAA